ncbi:LOW QUALITY PROTEIN: C-C chemokine receptor type 8-like [Lycodopsis pacificus]
MNTSENELYDDDYNDTDDYDYNDTWDEDGGPEFSESTVLVVLYYTLFCLSLLGNTTVLWVLLRYIRLKTMADVCLLNLALSDLIMAITMPFWTYKNPTLVSCKLLTGAYHLSFYSGTLFVTLMSVDRYLAIVHAVAAMRARTLRHGITASIIIWVISLVMALPEVTFASLEMDEDDNSFMCYSLYPEGSERFWMLLQNFSENTVCLFVCLPIMIFCYVKILVVLCKSRNTKKDRSVKLIFTTVCVFVVCWVPYNVIVFLQTLQLFPNIMFTYEAKTTINSAMHVVEILALSHCCVNPVIYAFVGEKFRKSLGKVLTRYPCWSHQSRTASQSTTDRETSNTPVKSDD